VLAFFKKATAVPPEKVLRKLGVAFETLPDGSLYVPGDIDLSHRKLEELPDLSNVRVGGSFFCHSNNLESLQGSPQIILGAFFCHNNCLTSLKGGPTHVGGDFSCGYNRISSLEGSPKTIGGSFMCYGNELRSLRGAPQCVSGAFTCDKNDLRSLEDAPLVFSSLKSDFGDFPSWEAVPFDLALSTKTKAIKEKVRHEFQKKVMFEEAIAEAAVLQKPLKVRKPFKLKAGR
jgi:hypothetical protein